MQPVQKRFVLKNKTIVITTPVDESNPDRVYSSRYFYVQMHGQRAEMVAKSDKTEFYNDIQTQLNFLEEKELTLQNYFDAFITGCIKHIEIFGRLIITDMYSQLNCTMHILDATNNLFHTYIKNEEDGIRLRNEFTESGMVLLAKKLLVPHPFLKEVNGMPKLIFLSERQTIR